MVRERLNYQAADREDSAYTTVMSAMVVLWRTGCLDRAKCQGKERASLVVRGPDQPTEEAQ